MALDKLEAMRAFCRIVETGSFKNAADALDCAATTLSGQIQALENHLGARLLHRTTRKVAPTADGLDYYRHILPLLEEIDEIHGEMQQGGAAGGLLRVEMPSPVADYLIVPKLMDFSARHPQLKMEIGSSERVVDLVRDGVDCAIRGGVLADETLVGKVIGAMPFCLCAAPAYLANRPAPAKPEDLAQHRYLAFKFAATGKLANLAFTQSDQPVFAQTPDITYNNAQTYYVALLAGQGVGFVPKAVAAAHIRENRLTEILPDRPLQSMLLSFVYPQSRYTPKRVKVFQAWLEELFAESGDWRI
ncbi:LysR family transcriptional regulator [Eikenella sp. S3360]|uniref:LysR family transcriptional regulator n=1 Tax=Eikenella glucosivorans TaxID=2766967 RepID=A0ABS0N9G7_9NEIS|nr:LysR family transcriptional regulator [Eikenella glucosivorans]MBH5328947.1 LysR family transcriptional regulator [Eikenella glucosivorans]